MEGRRMHLGMVIPVLLMGSHVLFTYATLCKLVGFLWIYDSSSQQRSLPLIQSWTELNRDHVLGLLWNLLLVFVFVLQHSFLKTSFIQELIQRSSLQQYARMIYVSLTNISLLFLTELWQPMDAYSAWSFSDLFASNEYFFRHLLKVLHVLAWYLVYASSSMMDLPDTLGVKQVYYDLFDLGSPLHSQTVQLQRFRSRIKHGSYSGFLILLWVRPEMTLDRLFLASALTAFMHFRWRPDRADFEYQREMWRRKKAELDAMDH